MRDKSSDAFSISEQEYLDAEQRADFRRSLERHKPARFEIELLDGGVVFQRYEVHGWPEARASVHASLGAWSRSNRLDWSFSDRETVRINLVPDETGEEADIYAKISARDRVAEAQLDAQRIRRNY